MPKLENSTALALHAANGTTYRRIASGVYSPVEFTILGQVYSKSNRRENSLNRRTGKTFSRKSDEALRYVQDFLMQVPPEFKKLKLGSREQLLRAVICVWYPSYQQDVDVELVYDCLQKSGVVSNDRWIRQKLVYGYVDADNARVQIRIEEIEICL